MNFKRPLGVTILSILYFLSAFASFFAEVDFYTEIPWICFCLLMGFGLWKIKNWARVAEIIFNILIILPSVVFLAYLLFKQNYYELLVAGIILGFACLINIIIIRYLIKDEIKKVFLT